MKRAERLFASREVNKNLSAAQISAHLEVSERTLYEAFRTCFGVGPHEYQLLCQMHRFRKAIVAGKPFHGKVSQSALSAGFFHKGRLTQTYRRHFGETPRQTMKRRLTQTR